MQPVSTDKGHDRRYTIALCKGAALLDETRTLLQYWVPGQKVDELVERVQRENALAKATAYRTNDIVRRVFVRRFLVPSDAPARRLKRIVERRLSRRLFAEVLFVYAARADALLYDFTTEVFWPACRRGRSTLSTPEVLDFLGEAAGDGRIPQAWSPSVQRKIARGVLSTLGDVGLLRDHGGRREIVPYYPTDEGIAYLAYDLRGNGLSDLAICGHPDWQLIGLDTSQLLTRLDSLPDACGLLVQRAGSLVRITWRYESVAYLEPMPSGSY
jgi:hypothetical protein